MRLIRTEFSALHQRRRFALINGDQKFALRPRDLPDEHAACSHAKAAIKQVFKDVSDLHEWLGWHLSIRDDDDQEFALLPVVDTLAGERR